MLNKYIKGNLLKTIFIFILSTLMALVLEEIGLRAENILLIFVVGILIIIVETGSFIWSTISAFVFVLTFNFFFTEPKFTFMVNNPNYFVSFGIFIIVAIIVTTLTVRLKRQKDIAQKNAEISKKLYEVSRGFLYLNNEVAITNYCEKVISDLLRRKCELFILCKETEKIVSRNKLSVEILWCYENSFACGNGETKFSKSESKYIPIRSGNSTLGVARLECTDKQFTENETRHLSTILFQLTIALERCWLNISEEENRIKIERENLRSNLLRSISHDLRTPLTGIAGGAEFLLDSIENVDNETQKSILASITSDALWLSALVDNLLNMTRIQDGRLTVTKKNEVVEDVVSEAISKVIKRKDDHTIHISKSQEIILTPMDAQLIIQVIINLLDNAIRHTRADSTIEISYTANKEKLTLLVSDNGGGVPNERLEHIFEPFFTSSQDSADKGRGMGLGLSICKSIIEAHNGKISVYNNKVGGATFEISLPLTERKIK